MRLDCQLARLRLTKMENPLKNYRHCHNSISVRCERAPPIYGWGIVERVKSIPNSHVGRRFSRKNEAVETKLVNKVKERNHRKTLLASRLKRQDLIATKFVQDNQWPNTWTGTLGIPHWVWRRTWTFQKTRSSTPKTKGNVYSILLTDYKLAAIAFPVLDQMVYFTGLLKAKYPN